jgi:hypothetical protein
MKLSWNREKTTAQVAKITKNETYQNLAIDGGC